MPTSPSSPFPLYLLPSFPFRRRRSSATTTSSNSTSSTPSSSPPAAPSYLSRPAPTSHLRCHKCLTDLIPTSSIISKGFTGRHGRAYLVAPPHQVSGPRGIDGFNSSGLSGLEQGELPNVSTHKPVPRQLVTGAHTVSDISCKTCGCVLGWKYVQAEEEAQKYKVGKYILETRRVVKGAEWEFHEGEGPGTMTVLQGDIEFDSQDEEECEDLFSGIWTPELARRRRKGRGVRRSRSAEDTP